MATQRGGIYISNKGGSGGGGGDTVRQVSRGVNRPTDSEILIWIETPPTGEALLTSDHQEVYTSDGEQVYVKKEETI